MTSLWRWFISILVWLSADPNAITEETPKAAAAVAVAYATFAPEPTPEVKPVKPVGPVTVPPEARPQCIDGKCRVPGAPPIPVSPARP